MDVLLFVGFASVLFAVYLYRFRGSRNGLPAGPPGIPVLGNILSFGKHPQLTILKWKEQYGDIFTVYDGRKPMVILSDFNTVRKVFGDEAVAGRDMGSVIRFDESTQKNLGLAFNEGPLWKVHRRFAVATLRDLGMGKNWLEDTIITEVEEFCEVLRQSKQRPFNPKVPLTNSISNVVCALIFGRRFELSDPKFSRLTRTVSEYIDSMIVDSLVQALPFLMWFPNPVRRRIIRGRETIWELNGFFRELIDARAAAGGEHEGRQDYLYAYQNEAKTGEKSDFSEGQLLASLNNLFAGGTETNATTTIWAFVFMLENSDVLMKVQEEIDTKTGRERMLTNADRGLLPYTEAMILEVQRCASLVPLSVPHKTLEAISVDGYTIPKDTIVAANLFSIHRDPRWWKNPEKFDPLRFLDQDMKIIRPEGYAPFSVGKRACLAEALAKMELFLFIANILRCFTISLPPGATISHHDVTSSIVVAPVPFELIFTPRDSLVN